MIGLYPDWLKNSDSFFHYCQQVIDWQSRKIRLFGQEHTIPRLECWLAEPGVDYGYSGQRYHGQGWPEKFRPVLKDLASTTGFQPNGALPNYYRSGQDTMGWHADDESELGINPTVAILSLGSARDFHFRNIHEHSRKLKLKLPAGSLLFMSGAVQHHWQHAVPRRAQGQPRISCTFRTIKRG